MLASSFKTMLTSPTVTSTVAQLIKPQVLVPLAKRSFSQNFNKPRPMQNLKYVYPSAISHSVKASLISAIQKKNNILKQLTKPKFYGLKPKFAFSTNYNAQKAHQRPINMSYDIPQDTIEVSSKTISTGNATVSSMIEKDMSLNKFMSKIYNTTGLSIASFLGIGTLMSSSAMMAPAAFLMGGFAMSIGGIIAFNWMKPVQTITKDSYGNITQFTENSFGRKVAFGSIIAGSGLAMAPFMAAVSAVSPAIIPAAAGLSIATMGGASLYSMSKPVGSFSTWRAPLYGSLMGMVAMQLVNLGLLMTIGPNAFSAACFKVDMYAGLGLFTAFQVYDTQKAVESYQNGEYDHLDHVIDFFLNFKNLFVRFASVLLDYHK